MKDADYIYAMGWVMGFVSAISAIYLVRRYFPDLFEPALQARLLVIRKEDTADAAPDPSYGMAGSDEIRADT